MAQNNQTYLFIDDPNHKLTLSGRVTAACLDCRREKKKCSGETDCQQCQAKGVICRMPPSRKRPRKAHALLIADTAVIPCDKGPRPQLSSSVPSSSQQQRSSVMGWERDSGYVGQKPRSRPPSSIGQLSPAGALTSSSAFPVPSAQGHPFHSRDTTMSGSAVDPAASPGYPTFTVPHGYDASLAQYSLTTDFPRPKDASGGMKRDIATASCHPSLTRLPVNLHSAHAPTMAMSARSPERYQKSSGEGWFSAPLNAQASTNMLTAADVLEQHAQDLRRQVETEQIAAYEDMSMQPLSQFQHYAAMSSDPMQATYYDPYPVGPGTFDLCASSQQDSRYLVGLVPRTRGGDSWSDFCDGERQAIQPTGALYAPFLHSNRAQDIVAHQGSRAWNHQYAS